MTELDALEAWLSEEGVETGNRFVSHIEYDCNWRGAFRVVLKSHNPKAEYIGEGPNKFGGLRAALQAALRKAGAK